MVQDLYSAMKSEDTEALSQCNETLLVRAAVRPGKKLLRKTCSDGDARTDSGRLFQTDAAAAGKVRSPMVARTVRGATSADVVEERSRRLLLILCNCQCCTLVSFYVGTTCKFILSSARLRLSKVKLQRPLLIVISDCYENDDKKE